MLADVLPSDIWISVLHYLSVADLSTLAQASRYFHALVCPNSIVSYPTLTSEPFIKVNEYGWKIHLKANPRHTWSLAKSMQLWNPYAQVR